MGGDNEWNSWSRRLHERPPLLRLGDPHGVMPGMQHQPLAAEDSCCSTDRLQVSLVIIVPRSVPIAVVKGVGSSVQAPLAACRQLGQSPQ